MCSAVSLGFISCLIISTSDANELTAFHEMLKSRGDVVATLKNLVVGAAVDKSFVQFIKTV